MTEQLFKKNAVIGALYAEDFDEVFENKIEKIDIMPEATEILTPSEPNEEILQKRYEDGIQEGRRLEKQLCNQEKIELEGKLKKEISSVVGEINKKIDENKNEISKELSGLMLKTLLNIFPNILTNYEFLESEKTFERIYPIINGLCSIKLTCSKEFFDRIEKYIQGEFQKNCNINIDEKLKGADFDISWDAGRISHKMNEAVMKITKNILPLSSNE